MDLDFKRLTPDQEQVLREILQICRYFEAARLWRPAVDDNLLAKQARQIGELAAKLK